MLLRTEIKNELGEWVEGAPVVDEPYRQVIKTGEMLQPAELLPEHFDAEGNQIVFPEPVTVDKLAYIEGVYALPQADPTITKLEFKQRMTAQERIAIRQAANTDPIIFDFMDLVESATYIDLSRQDTQDGVNYLESQGLLASGRAAAILTY